MPFSERVKAQAAHPTCREFPQKTPQIFCMTPGRRVGQVKFELIQRATAGHPGDEGKLVRT